MAINDGSNAAMAHPEYRVLCMMPHIDNIDTYNRYRALITQLLSDRLGLGQNSLPGAQQVRVATEHTNQMTDIPDHLRRISLGEETESTSYEETDRNGHIILMVPWTVGIVVLTRHWTA